jgi:hypothetical protein
MLLIKLEEYINNMLGIIQCKSCCEAADIAC